MSDYYGVFLVFFSVISVLGGNRSHSSSLNSLQQQEKHITEDLRIYRIPSTVLQAMLPERCVNQPRHYVLISLTTTISASDGIRCEAKHQCGIKSQNTFAFIMVCTLLLILFCI